MLKKDKQILLRIEQSTYQKIKYYADKYDRSVNSEINLLLKANFCRWDFKNVKVHELPREVKEIQEDWDSKEYDRLLDEVTKPIKKA